MQNSLTTNKIAVSRQQIKSNIKSTKLILSETLKKIFDNIKKKLVKCKEVNGWNFAHLL